jgi:hypothetical protein
MLSNIGEFPAVFWTRGLVMKTENKEQPGQGNTEVLSSAAVARRHALLKGLSRGSVLLAASVPLQTLASGSVLTDPAGGPQVKCSISGQMSGVGSQTTSSEVCNGYSPGYWKFPDKHPWPFPAEPDTPCVDIFKYCTLMMPDPSAPVTVTTTPGKGKGKPLPPPPVADVPASLVYVMQHNNLDQDHFHWIAAWLNGLAQTSGFNYPYSGDEILAFYNGTGPYSADVALDFIKKYLEIHP